MYKGILQAIHGAADVDKQTLQTMIHLQQLTSGLSTIQMKMQISSAPCESCVYYHTLMSPFGFTLRFSSCQFLVCHLLPNQHHSAAVMQHTSCYCAKGKFFFTKVDDYHSFKLCPVLKFCPLSLNWRSCVSPNAYHQKIPIVNSQHLLTTALYLYHGTKKKKELTYPQNNEV